MLLFLVLFRQSLPLTLKLATSSDLLAVARNPLVPSYESQGYKWHFLSLVSFWKLGKGGSGRVSFGLEVDFVKPGLDIQERRPGSLLVILPASLSLPR